MNIYMANKAGVMGKVMNIEILNSQNSNVKKFIFKTNEKIAESVLYKYPEYSKRTVMCISTQSGCAMGCKFCGAGSGFIANMSSGEIFFQVKEMLNHIDCEAQDIENWQIMFMSMGEPMHNYKELERVVCMLSDQFPNAKLLISTSAPRSPYWLDLIKLSVDVKQVGLQFSVHESNDEKRNDLIPNKNKLSLREIGAVGEVWAMATGKRPFFNYCVHDQNNSHKNIEELLVNFPPNTFEATISVICEKDETVSQSILRQEFLAKNFSLKMTEAGYSTRVFNPAGQDDIGGGCGQLWQVQKFFKKKGA